MTPAIDANRLKRVSKEGAWVILGQVAAILGALVGVRILTETLDPASYGDLALGMTLATLVHQCVFGPLGHGATRFWSPAESEKAQPEYVATVRRLTVGAAAGVFAAGGLASVLLWAADQKFWSVMTILACGFAMLRGVNSVLGGMQNAARQRIVVALHQGGEVWLRFLLAALLVTLTTSSGIVAMSGFLLAMLGIVASQVFFFRKRVPVSGARPDGDPQWQRRIRQFAWPFAVFGLFTWAQLASSRWSLEAFADTADVGYFAVLFQLGFYPMSILTAMVVQYLAPIFYQKAGDASDPVRTDRVQALGGRLTAAAIVLTCVATLLAFLLHDWVFRLLVAAEYRSVSHLLPWLVLAGGVVASAQTVELNLMSMLETGKMMGAKIVTAAAGVVLNILGARYYGTAGVVAANLAFAVPFLVWMLLLIRGVRRGRRANA